MTAILITILVIIALLVLFDIIIAIIIFSLKKRVNKKMSTIDVLTAQKYDLLISSVRHLKKIDVEIPEKLNIVLELNADYNLKYVTTTERLSLKALLYRAETIFLDIVDSKQIKNEEIIKIKDNINETNLQLRKETASYNADVGGYNYWINFFVFRPIAFILKMKPYEYLE